MNWKEVTVDTSHIASEAVSEILNEAGAEGISILDDNDMVIFENEDIFWDYIDEKAAPKDLNRAVLKAYYKDNDEFEKILKIITEKVNNLPNYNLPKGKGEITVKNIRDEDWQDEWKKYYKTVHITPTLVIRPLWDEYSPKGGETVIAMDSGTAFGTGQHETTSMCLKLLEKYIFDGASVLDIGTGSGILAIAAAKLGAKKVSAVDLDEIAVKVCEENIKLNGMQEKIDVFCGNLTENIHAKYDIIMANIMADAIMILEDTIGGFMTDKAVFISSGIIEEKALNVKQNAHKNNFEIIETLNEKDWVAYSMKKQTYDTELHNKL